MLTACVCQLASAPSAQALGGFFSNPGLNGCPSLPPGSAVDPGYYWVGTDGTCGGGDRWISTDQFKQLVDEGTASVDEARGVTIPADIATNDASIGAKLWDGAKGALSATKTYYLDWLAGAGSWANIASLGGVSLAVGAGLIGWSIGSSVANLLGFSNGPDQPPASYNVTVTSLVPISAGTLLPTYCPNAGGAFCTDYGTVAPYDSWLLSTNSTVAGFVNNRSGVTVTNCCGDPPSQCDKASVKQAPTATIWYDVTYFASDNFCHNYPSGASGPGTTRVGLIPVQTLALPGPGQGALAQPANGCENAAGCTQTNTVPAPSEAQTKGNVSNTLTTPGPGGANTTWWTYVCHTAGTACYGSVPQPSTGTITLPAITPNETYNAWADAARNAGLLGSITKNTLSDTLADPTVAPNDVVRTSPQAGTQVDPQTAVTVYVNPDTVGSIGAAPGAPTLPGLVLPQAPTPCNVFPFGVPCWLKNQLGQFTSTTPQAPAFSIGTPSLLGGGNLNVNLDHPFGADLSGIMSVLRIVLLVVSFLGLMLWAAGFALGGSTGGGGGAEAEE
jgi:hypothetical protein